MSSMFGWLIGAAPCRTSSQLSQDLVEARLVQPRKGKIGRAEAPGRRLDRRWRRRRRTRRRELALHHRGQLSDRLVLEDLPQRDAEVVFAAAGNDLDGTDGIAAQLEEILVD